MDKTNQRNIYNKAKDTGSIMNLVSRSFVHLVCRQDIVLNRPRFHASNARKTMWKAQQHRAPQCPCQNFGQDTAGRHGRQRVDSLCLLFLLASLVSEMPRSLEGLEESVTKPARILMSFCLTLSMCFCFYPSRIRQGAESKFAGSLHFVSICFHLSICFQRISLYQCKPYSFPGRCCHHLSLDIPQNWHCKWFSRESFAVSAETFPSRSRHFRATWKLQLS